MQEKLPLDAARCGKICRMRQRNLRVVKWIGTIPVIGVCTVCDRSFTVPLPAMKKVADAQESLKVQFAEHKCKRQDATSGASILEAD
jgi:hypothetical protein